MLVPFDTESPDNYYSSPGYYCPKCKTGWVPLDCGPFFDCIDCGTTLEEMKSIITENEGDL
jgi:hypothetical protein